MHRVVPRGRRGYFAALAAPALSLVVATAANAAPAKVFVFGAKPNTAFEVRKNSIVQSTKATTALGSLSVDLDLAPGDRVDMLGSDTAPPVPPLFSSLATNEPGCATAAWLPSGDPTVVGYVVSFGTRSVAGGEAAQYDHSIEMGTATVYTECSLPNGRYYFAVQARNAGGVMSTYSTERSVVIQTVAVLISMFEATNAENGVRLAWRVEADEVVSGLLVYRSEGTGPESRITDTPMDVGTTAFLDESVRAGTDYHYTLAAIKENGDEVRSITASVTTPALELALGQNYPNPFNPTTQIPFALESAGRVLVRVFDVRGKLVATLLDEIMAEGRHSVDWSGVDDRGQPVASGLYLYSLTTGKRTMSKKMMLMK